MRTISSSKAGQDFGDATSRAVAPAAGSVNWHQLATIEVVQRLGSDVVLGLDEREAQLRLARHGPNELPEPEARGLWRILWEQVSALMVVVLVAAAVISVALGHVKDASVIFAIVILNAAFGMAQDYRAEKAMGALRRLAAPLVKVRRGGLLQSLPARDLVPGDLVVLETGDIISADCRVLDAINLQLNESSLTGESASVAKVTGPLRDENVMLPERKNMVWRGTSVVAGRGLAIVAETGERTELGRIASQLGSVRQERTPLQRRLDELAQRLSAVVFVLVAIIFVLGFLRGEPASLMLLTAISMAVAALPEGLPAVVTITLALGSQRMLRRRALIRRLPAAEGLGSVTVICSDKTGTITENRMAVTVLMPVGEQNEATATRANSPAQGETWLLVAAALCNDSRAESERSESAQLDGDPMEVALVAAARSRGLEKKELDLAFPRVAEIPFDSTRKRMTTLHRCNGPDPGILREQAFPFGTDDQVAFMKGALESVMEACDRQRVAGAECPLDTGTRERIRVSGERLAETGARVLGFAYRTVGAVKNPTLDEERFVFLGLMGLSDPTRPEVRAAVESCRSAGIRPVIITGDHPLTARHVAGELGMDGRILTGAELDALPFDQLRALVEETSIYARVLPEHKFQIVRALQDRGHVVAMTGDGVNDATALKQADIGVAMGRSGTDVAKQAADMVLLDDQFATIVAAVEEGRAIYDNIRKFVRYVLAGNLGELFVMLIGPFFGLSLPLLPLQILWINLASDGINGLGFSVEQSEGDVMQRPPRSPAESFFGGGMARHIFTMGILLGVVALGAGLYLWAHHSAAWQTAIFLTLALGQTFQALAARSWRDSAFRKGFLSNPLLLASVVLAASATLLIAYLPAFQMFFGTHALPPGELFAVLALSTVIFWAIELEKWYLRRVRVSATT